MKQMLLATHGHFASGIKSALEIIVGEQENLQTIDAYVDETNFEEQLDAYLSTINMDEVTLLVITDLFGGSVNQKIIDKLQNENVHIVTGLNLPLLLELQMLNEEDCTKENIASIVEKSRQQVQSISAIAVDDEDDFDF